MTAVPRNGAVVDDPLQVRRSRVLAVDAARGVALVGMAAVHLYPVATSDGHQTWAWALFSGKAAALFAVLAGVSLAFMSGGRHPSADGRTRGAICLGLAVRAALIAVLGLTVGLLVDDPYLILPYYGIMFLLAVPVLYAPTRVLLFLAVVSALVTPFIMQGLRPDLPRPFLVNASLLDVVVHPWRLLTSLLLTGIYPAIPWMTYICLGLVIGRRNLRDVRVARWLLGAGVALGVLPLLVSRLLLDHLGGYDALLATPGLSTEEVYDIVEWGPDPVLPSNTSWWLTIDAAHSSTPIDLLHTSGVAMAVLGAVLLLERVRWVRKLLVPFAAAGTLTLTLYTLNVVLTWTGLYTDYPTALWLTEVVLGLIAATLWRHTYGQGPLERLVAAGAHRARDAVLRGGRTTSAN